MSGKRKSLYTVKEATGIAFKAMAPVFDGISLVNMTRALLARPSCMDGTIMRRLRELREDEPEKYGYEVIDTDLSRYKKRELQPASNLAQ